MTTAKSAIQYLPETKEILDLLYKNAPSNFTLPDGTKEDVPATGNLGLLSLGYEGLLAIRKKREEMYGDKIQFPLFKYSTQKDEDSTSNNVLNVVRPIRAKKR